MNTRLISRNEGLSNDFFLTLQSISRDHGIPIEYKNFANASTMVRFSIEYKNHLDKDATLKAYIFTTDNECVLMGKHLVFRDFRYSEDVFKILIHDWQSNNWEVLHTVCILIKRYIQEMNFRNKSFKEGLRKV